MRNHYGKQIILSLLSLCCINAVSAANNPPVQQNAGATNAIAFGIQAGQIAGSAQGCGLNIATFTTRAGEAINKLALNPVDSSAANSAFQQALQQAQINQRNNNPLPCSQVTQDFNNLPLLRPDYQQTVIAQLTPGMNNNQASDNNAPAGNNPAAAPGQTGTQSNAAAANNTGANQSTPNPGNNTATAPGNNNSATTANNPPPNPAYPQQGYGPMKSFSNNYSGAIKPYGMENMPQQQMQSANTATTQSQPQQPDNNYSQQNNNPSPPNFSNPNNAPAANSGYPNQ